MIITLATMVVKNVITPIRPSAISKETAGLVRFFKLLIWGCSFMGFCNL